MKKLLWISVLIASIGGWAIAQDIANHSIPIGGGPGAVGWKTGGPCADGQALVWNDINADPQCTSVGGGGSSPGGVNHDIQFNNAGLFGGFTMGGDCTVNTATGVMTCTKTNGTSFSAAATTAIGTAGAVLPLLNGNNTYSGNNTHTGTQNFSNAITSSGNNSWSGRNTFSAAQANTAWPFVDIKSGANGCAAAAVDGVTDDSAAVQCQINYLATHGNLGGIVFFPQGTTALGSTITVKKSVMLQGIVVGASGIKTLSDIQAINFDSSATFGGMNNLWVFCDQTTGSSKRCVQASAGSVSLIIRDVNIYGGFASLRMDSVDSIVENVVTNPTSVGVGAASVESVGSNWYVRCKFDTNNVITYGFNQGNAGGGVQENHFIQTDFTGSYTESVHIDDGGTNAAVFVFEGSVFSSPVHLNRGRLMTIIGGEIGGAITHDSGSLIISGTYAFSPTAVSGAGTSRACAANINITC